MVQPAPAFIYITGCYILFNGWFYLETYARLRKVGGSLMVRVPAEIARAQSLKEGELIKIDIQKPKKSGFGILKGLGPFKHEDVPVSHV